MNELDFLLIGAGQANIPLARTLSGAGKRVAIAERKHLGGSCVNFGCTPTKAVIASARVAYLARHSDEWGVSTGEVRIDYPAVLKRAAAQVKGSIDSLRAGLRESGVTLLNGHARFVGRRDGKYVVRVGDEEHLAPNVVLDTGTRTRVPSIDGIEGVRCLDAGNWLAHDTLPDRLVVIGGGYIGIEMAQFYRRMGSGVIVIESGDQILPHEDDDIARAVQERLEKEQIAFHLNARVTAARRSGGSTEIVFRVDETDRTVTADAIFIATGRQPNTDDLGLETIDLHPAQDGTLEVDDQFSTRAQGVYAVGDIRGGPRFTHTSWDDHRVLEHHFLGIGPRTSAERIVPYAVFTDPELGRVGMTAKAARDTLGERVEVKTFDLASSGRAHQMGEAGGMIKLVIDTESDSLLGAAVLAPRGAELVAVYIALMNAGAPLDVIRRAIFIHPTLAEAIQSAAM